MKESNPIEKVRSELQEGMELAKCHKCGCMKNTLENLYSSLATIESEGSCGLRESIDQWLGQLKKTEYSCLGCEHCFPAVATNIFSQTFPAVTDVQFLSCDFEQRQTWPPIPGEYFSFGNGSVAVSTLASNELAKKLASLRPTGLAIVGKTETENIGIDKVVKNTISNPSIRYLIVAGDDPKGHQSGRTLLALWENGVDEQMKVVDSPGKRPVLKNVTVPEVEYFRKQVQVIDMIGCKDAGIIVGKIGELSGKIVPLCSCPECSEGPAPVPLSIMPSTIKAEPPSKIELDEAGYFVIIPQPERQLITVEHYSYDNELLRTIEGTDARSIYWTIIENGWVTRLSHAAYIGKELTRAEILGSEYVQDGA